MLEIKIPKSLYSDEALRLTILTFNQDFNIQVGDEHQDDYKLIIEGLEGTDIPGSVSNDFQRALNENQVRLDLENRFGQIRNKIIDAAFAPIQKPE